mgnify:CR=1 FL=1
MKTGLVDQGDKAGRWERSSGEEEHVINIEGESCGKRKEDYEDTKAGEDSS